MSKCIATFQGIGLKHRKVFWLNTLHSKIVTHERVITKYLFHFKSTHGSCSYNNNKNMWFFLTSFTLSHFWTIYCFFPLISIIILEFYNNDMIWLWCGTIWCEIIKYSHEMLRTMGNYICVVRISLRIRIIY